MRSVAANISLINIDRRQVFARDVGTASPQGLLRVGEVRFPDACASR